jgi:branched-chain amino acid transport system substrate-binding protein
MRLDPARTAAVAIDMHRGHLDPAVLGVITPLHYSAALETPANRKFTQACEANFKQVPSHYSEGIYVAGLVLESSLEATGGDNRERRQVPGGAAQGFRTSPNVSQFWTYKPDEFLKQLVSDRNNPPCKHCQ